LSIDHLFPDPKSGVAAPRWVTVNLSVKHKLEEIRYLLNIKI